MNTIPGWAVRAAAPVTVILLVGTGAAAASGEPTPSASPSTAPEIASTPPTTEAPTTEAPTTEAPTTGVPTTEAPTTEARSAEAPASEPPTTSAPTTVACDAARNHGEYVSSVARTTPKGPGHGQAVSEAARSDCGKHAKEPKADKKPKHGSPDGDKSSPGNGKAGGHPHGKNGAE